MTAFSSKVGRSRPFLPWTNRTQLEAGKVGPVLRYSGCGLPPVDLKNPAGTSRPAHEEGNS